MLELMTMTPEELATELDISPKALRAWLRETFPRRPAETGRRWVLEPHEMAEARTRFGPQQPSIPRPCADPPRPASGHGQSVIDSFLGADLHTRDEVLAKPSPLPSSSGVYGWWFRELPTTLDTTACVKRNGLTLLYTGISPRKPPANGRPPSKETLRSRVTYHYTGNAEGSTLRKTLGCLLALELGIELRRVGSGKRITFIDGEQTLSTWMGANALVGWLVHPEPWILEQQLIGTIDVPLNLDGNRHNRFHPELTAARAAAVARARSLPPLPNPGVGGR